jgi:hypothetical protein
VISGKPLVLAVLDIADFTVVPFQVHAVDPAFLPLVEKTMTF